MGKVILSCDGGGIRGAATTQFLARIEAELKRKHKKSIRDCVDFFAGTSTGSIIALALATTKMSMDQINNLYNVDNARQIFSSNKGLFEIDGITAPKFEGDGKTTLLKKNFAKSTIGNVPKGKHVLAVTYGVERRKPEIIKSTRKKYCPLLSYQVADASSAAPTYFPTTKLTIGTETDDFWLIDGGVVANNPTMCAIVEAKRTWTDTPTSQLRVLSIGTGFQSRKINGPDSVNWGATEWFIKGKIMNLLMDERVVAYQAMTLIEPGKYIRVNSELKTQPGLDKPPDDALDDISPSNIFKLKALGDFWFDRYGKAAINLLLNRYKGKSLDSINPTTGYPVKQI